MPRLLVFGIGNPGRQDDALGIEFVEMFKTLLKKEVRMQVDFDSNYQLNIEDAETISAYDQVLFVDASLEPIEAYKLEEVAPADARVEFTMHAVSPSFIVDLCQKMFGKSPKAYALHIKGYGWELGEKMTKKAADNLQASARFIKNIMDQKNGMILKPKY